MKLFALLAWSGILSAQVIGHSRWGSVLVLELEGQKKAEIEWVSSSGVRVRLVASSEPRLTSAVVPFTVTDGPLAITAKTRDLMLEIAKKPLGIRFISGAAEAVDFQWAADGVAEFKMTAAESFYGLGARTDARMNVRGHRIRTDQPLLLSSRGYGVHFPLPGIYDFDIGRSKPELLRVRSDSLAFYFYFTGEPKSVLEQHHERQRDVFEFTRADVSGVLEAKPEWAFRLPGGKEGRNALINGSMSGLLVPAVPVTDPLSALMPVVLADGEAEFSPDARAQRKLFETHFLTYVQEARDRGIPVVHPLALQFPLDPSIASRTDEFMLGDELLVATAKEVYLPQGYWTEWKSGVQHRGRRAIRLNNSDPWTLFARNGTIVPIDRAFGIELHYFPKLGAEYFIVEPELGLLTQVHAGPSAEALRLEIEEKTGREYEWVIYHVSRPVKVMRGDAPVPSDSWSYDERTRLLRIRTRAEAADDVIVNVTFEKENWYFAP